jgi:phosphopantothenoylcysteine decarboxylase/phosphopantothenate--cysteine ligase
MGNALKGRRIVVGITGSIAAYKACELIRRLTEAGAEVQTVLTEHATAFIGEQT